MFKRITFVLAAVLVVDIFGAVTPTMAAVVPNVVGLEYSQAVSVLNAAGLSVGGVQHRNSATVPEGHIISQSLTPGTSVPEGTRIYLTISAGPETVYFPDVNLKAAVEAELGVTNPTSADMLALTSLWGTSKGIGDLTGLEYATNLTEIHLYDNQISNLSPLAGLTNLRELYLSDNQISDLSPLVGLTNLILLTLSDNDITDLSPLAGLTNLLYLGLQRNQISDIFPLVSLRRVDLSIDLRGNPLNQDAYNIYIPQLEAQGVEVLYDPYITVTVPNVVGLHDTAAKDAIAAAELVHSMDHRLYVHSDTVPRNHVISQDPAGGTLVPKGSVVYLVMSLGPPPVETVEVPYVVGMSENNANSMITSAGLVVSHSYEYSNTVPEGRVISQSPSAGTSVDEGSTVHLTVSLGPPPVYVPNVVGMTQVTATSEITSAGLVVGTISQAYSDSVAVGRVISQSPSAGTSVPEGSTVNLTISIGPPPPEAIEVPDVVGMREYNADSEITSEGLNVSHSYEYSDTVAEGYVISQYPSAGTSVDEGSYVDLTVSLGPPPPPETVEVPYVVGMSEYNADSEINSAGLNVSHSYEYSDTVAEGYVISQYPSAGTSVDEGSYVDLTVSRGPQPGGGPSDPVTPEDASLLAHWKLDEGSGMIATDASGNGHDSIAQSDPTWVDGPEGYGKAMYFDGTDPALAWVDCGTWNPSAKTGQLTVALWAKWYGPTGQNQGLIGKRDRNNPQQMMWDISIDKVNHWISFSRSGSYPWCGGIDLPEGQWSHVAATFDGSTMVFYVNGNETGRGDFSFGSRTDATIALGSVERDGWDGFHGALDDVRLYCRALSANEIVYLTAEQLTTFVPSPDGLLACYPLDGTADDISGNGINGTIFNAETGGLGDGGSVWVDDPERGTVISFNGTASSAYVRAGEIPQMTLTNDFTWSFWAKHSDENTADNDIILGNRMDENAVDFVPCQFIKFTPTKFEWHMNGNGDDNLDYEDIPADVWLHHAVVKTGDQLTYYRDGVEHSSGVFTQPLDFPQPLFFGGDNEGAEGENWSGLMSYVCIYDRALSEDEIRNLARYVPVLSDYTNLLDNGGFEDGVLEPWNIYDTIGGGATGEVVRDDPVEGSYCLHVVVPSVGVNFWDKGLGQGGYVFEKGKKYTLSAFLKCRAGTMNINFKPEQAQSPWTSYGENIVTMTDEWAEYSITTPVMTEDVNPANITFHIGFSPGDFWIDGVRFYEGDYVPPDL